MKNNEIVSITSATHWYASVMTGPRTGKSFPIAVWALMKAGKIRGMYVGSEFSGGKDGELYFADEVEGFRTYMFTPPEFPEQSS